MATSREEAKIRGRRTKRLSCRALSKVWRIVFTWKTLVLVTYTISFVLISQTLYSLLLPRDYPTSNLENIENFRSMEEPPSLPPEVMRAALHCSVQFLDCPINSKQRFDVNLDILKEVTIKWVCEVRLTGSGRAEWVETRFLTFEKVNDLEVFLNGQSVNCNCVEYEGVLYYNIPGFNLTEENEIKRLEIQFKVERETFTYDLAKTPWLFNENYSKFINFPIINIPVQVQNRSDLSTFRIKLGLPFRELLIDQSGWMDAFVNPRSEWILTNREYGTYEFHFFEYPIEQEREKEANTYFFKTYFSENNIANLVQMVMVPTWKIPALLVLFVSSPFYIPPFVWVKSKVKDMSGNRQHSSKERDMIYRISKIIIMPLQLYIGPLAFVLAFLIEKANLELFVYLMEIMRWGLLGLLLVTLYPVFFSLIFYKWKKQV
jgi:hypothetical protein